MRPSLLVHSVTALSLTAMAGLSGCDDLKRIDDDPTSSSGVPPQVQEVFDRSCNTTGCHNADDTAGALSLDAGASADVIGKSTSNSDLPLVEIGNPQGSYLAVKLMENNPALVGARMPFGANFDDPQVALDNAIIIAWIAGADFPGDGGGDNGGDTTGDDGADSDDGSSGGDGEIVACGLADVAPTATNPFDIGDAAGQIPPDVGMALTNNCGCHGPASDELASGVPGYGGLINFATIEEFNADFMGRPVHEVILERVQDDGAGQMPPTYYCHVGGGATITAADQQLLVDWLMAGAPDAPTWAGG